MNIPAAGGWLTVIQRNAGLRVVHPSADPRQDLVAADLSIAEVSLGVLGYELLIGRDLLEMCRFVYDGLADVFELTWR